MSYKPKYGIGTTFKTRGKAPRLCTVEDVWVTYDLRGHLVRVRYVASHELMGKVVMDYDVPEITIDMGLVKQAFANS